MFEGKMIFLTLPNSLIINRKVNENVYFGFFVVKAPRERGVPTLAPFVIERLESTMREPSHDRLMHDRFESIGEVTPQKKSQKIWDSLICYSNLYENLLMIVSIKASAVTGPSFLSILRIAI